VRDVDGRLDLDDLGRVLDQDSHDPAELLGEESPTTWGERLDDLGVRPWLRRHRVAITTAAACVAVVIAASVVGVRSRPPDLDPTLHVRLSDITPTSVPDSDVGGGRSIDGPQITDIGGVQRAAYALRPESSDDTAHYAVVGLVGPGVRASSARAHAPLPARPFAGDVDVVLDCNDPDALAPPPHSYRALVTRTDSYGRTVTASMAVPDESENWPVYVAAFCMQSRAMTDLTVTGVSATSDVSAHSVLVEAAVHSSIERDLVLTVFDIGLPEPLQATSLSRAIDASGDALVRILLSVNDCTTPRIGQLGVPTSSGDGGQSVPGLYLVVSAPDRDPSSGVTGILRWTGPQQRRIDLALAAVCRGAPSVRTTLSAVHASAPSAGPAQATAAITLAIATSGQRVAVSPSVFPYDQAPTSQITTGSAGVNGGVALVTVGWRGLCDHDYVEPPTVVVHVTTDHGTFPYLARIASFQLARIIPLQCPSITADQLTSFGWDPGPA
jgi:hypothetical protein